MNQIIANCEPAGIRKSWIKGLNKFRAEGDTWRERMREFADGRLHHYVETGRAHPDFDPETKDGGSAQLPRSRWERPDVELALVGYGDVLTFECHMRDIGTETFHSEMAARAFSSMYLAQLLGNYREYLWPLRANYHKSPAWFSAFPYLGFGMLVGCRSEVTTLIRMIAVIYRRSPRSRPAITEPIGFFMLRLMADFVGETPPPISDYNRQFPSYFALFDNWRDPDPQRIAPLCLTLLDLHTHMRGGRLPSGEHGEFNVPVWPYTPIEILLLFRLRQWLGLENPRLDHPLMCGPYANLPPEVPFCYDPLVAQVLDRLRQDGFDEAKVIDCVLNDRYPLPKIAGAA